MEKLLEKAMIGFNGDSTALLHCKAYEYSTHYNVHYVVQLTYNLSFDYMRYHLAARYLRRLLAPAVTARSAGRRTSGGGR